MNILNAGYSAELTLVANDVVTINPGASVVVEAVSGLGLSAGVIGTYTDGRTLGPYLAGVVKLTAVMGDCSYGVSTGVSAVTSTVNPLTGGIDLLGPTGAIITLKRRNSYLSKCWMGKVSSVANAASHSTRVLTTLECHTDRVRIGIINCVAADLVGVKVSVASTPALPADLASLATLTAGGSGWKTGTLASDTVLAGVDTYSTSITWTDWIAVSTIDRSDTVGARPCLAVTIQAASTIPNLPKWNSTAARSGWESEGSETVAPYGRPYKSRTQAVLAVDTAAAITSTTFDTAGMPFIIQYVPRNCEGFTVLTVGDSIGEGVGGSIVGHGYPEIARNAVSTQSRPVEICQMAISSATPTNWVSRQAIAIPAVLPEVVLLHLQSPNSWSPPTISNNPSTGNIQSMRQQVGRIRQIAGDAGAVVIGVKGVPMLRDASEAAGSGEDYDASISFLNDYLAAVSAGNLLVADTYAPTSGVADADGQMRLGIGLSADGLHPNDAGNTLMAAPVANKLKSVYF